MKKHIKKVAISQLPDIELMALDSSIFHIKKTRTSMQKLFFYFHPECELCSIEIEELLRHTDVLSNVQIVFVSSASIDEIKTYLSTYQIDSLRHTTIAHDYKGDLCLKLHIKSPPACYIYDSSFRLKKNYIGLTPISEILKYISSEQYGLK